MPRRTYRNSKIKRQILRRRAIRNVQHYYIPTEDRFSDNGFIISSNLCYGQAWELIRSKVQRYMYRSRLMD
ncbi:MAG: hypothetical protein AB9861_03950 [Methanosarcina sp.]